MEEVLYQITDQYLVCEKEIAMKPLNTVKGDLKFIVAPTEIGDFPRYLKVMQQCLDTVMSAELVVNEGEILRRLQAYYENIVNQQEEKEIAINDRYIKQIDEIEYDKLNDLRAYNENVRLQHEQENQVYIDLENKRRVLESYHNEVLDLCAEYDIYPSDIEIDNSSFTIGELGNIYDQYINYMDSRNSKNNFIHRFRDFIGDSPVIEAIVLVVLIAVMITPILSGVAILFFGLIIRDQLSVKQKMKSYAVLLGLIDNVHPLEMGFKSEVDSNLLKKESIDEDNDPELQKLAEEWQNELKQINSDAIVELQNKEITNFKDNGDEISKKVRDTLREFNEEKANLVDDIQTKLKSAAATFEELKSKQVLLGDAISESYCFDTNFRLGIKDEIIEEYTDIGMRNIIIKPCRDVLKQRTFIQMLFANALCNVKAGQLTTYIYDPNNFGQDLVEFYNEELQQIIKFENEKFDNVIGILKEFAENNLKTMRGMTINEYNEEAARVGKTTKEYRLLIVLSQPKSIEENEALSKFMSYSAKLGVFIWAVMDAKLSDTKIFNMPFEGIKVPYIKKDMSEFCIHVSNTLVDAIKNGKTESLLWEDFISICCPKDKIWTFSTDKYVDLDPGFWEGDPTQFQGYTVGNDGDVHALAVGTTGAGKSVFLNQLVANATRKYSPRELELWMVDFKGSEFSFYLSTPQHEKVLPHIKACLCTSDGDYAGSLYKALRAEAERRYKYLMDCGFKNMLEYNKSVRRGDLYEYIDQDGKKCYKAITDKSQVTSDMRQMGIDDLMSRILFINDEFQVIFEKAEPKVVEQISADITYITKVARACGVHQLYTSQSMKGTIKEDTLQNFTLRFALRCDREVSQTVMGTNFASEIKQKFGFLYVRSAQDKSLQAQKRYRTPFASDSVLRAHINSMADRAAEEHMPKRDMITYEESTKHNIREINAVYSVLKAVPSGLMLLGPRMTYSTNKSPENVILGAENNTHIVSAFDDTTDLVNFYRTIKRNIDLGVEGAQILLNSQLRDLHYLCEIDKDYDESTLAVSTETTSVEDFIAICEKIYNARKEMNIKDKPVYVITLGWDKGVGFGIDREYDLTQKLASMLQLCGEYNMHFIFITTNAKQVPPAVISACKYGICGKTNEDSSYAVLGTKQGCKQYGDMKNGYMFLQRGGVVSRCKIYQTKIEREVKSSELVL